MSSLLPLKETPAVSSPISTYKTCAHCNKSREKMQRCVRCRLSYYCKIECQKADWSKHKVNCIKSAKNRESKITEKKVASISSTKKTASVPGLTVVNEFISEKTHDEFVEYVKRNCVFTKNSYGLYESAKLKNDEKHVKILTKIALEIFPKLRDLGIFTERPITIAVSLIHYDKDGFIPAHIDSDEQSAGSVAALSFGSDVVVNFIEKGRLSPEGNVSDGGKVYKVLVPRKSMYCMAGDARYKFKHAICPKEATYESRPIGRGDRWVLLLTPPGPTNSGTKLVINDPE